MSERKVVINACFGGFGLSEAGYRRYAELKAITLYPEKGQFGLTHYWTVSPEARPTFLDGAAFYEASTEERQASNAAYSASQLCDRDFPRDDPELIRVVEELGPASNGDFAELKVVSIPADVSWHIDEYDGNETIREDHRTWS
jgi:hypothetical protein